MGRFAFQGLTLAIALTAAPLAHAEGEEGAVPETDASEESQTAPPPEPDSAPARAETSSPKAEAPTGKSSREGADGARFRFGISGGPSFFKIKDDFGNSASLTYGGMDLRFGVQVNDMIGVYAQPVLGFYNAPAGGALATGGLLGSVVAADVTLIDHFFVGGGFGYHIYNNPGGPSLLFRAGAYPLMGRSKEKVRRKGLMLGADVRVTFIGEGIKPILMPSFNLGYEAF